MYIVVNSKELSTRSQLVSKVQSPKSTLAILECILFQVSQGTLRLTASDSEASISAVMPIVEQDESDFIFAVNTDRFLPLIKELGDQPITLDYKEDVIAPNKEYRELTIRHSRGDVHIPCDNGVFDWPTPRNIDGVAPEEIKTGNITPSDLAEGIRLCIKHAVKDDTLRPHMCGVCIDPVEDGLGNAVASDGHSLGLVKLHGNIPSQFVISAKDVDLLSNILPRIKSIVMVSVTESYIRYVLDGEYTVDTRRIDKQSYPKYASIIPQNPVWKLRISRADLIAALRRLSIAGNRFSSLARFDINGCNISIKSEDIDFNYAATESITAEDNSNPQPISIGGNMQILTLILNSIKSDSVIIELFDPTRAMLFRDADTDNVLFLLMPMMLQ